jgi:hypothetical protein
VKSALKRYDPAVFTQLTISGTYEVASRGFNGGLIERRVSGGFVDACRHDVAGFIERDFHLRRSGRALFVGDVRIVGFDGARRFIAASAFGTAH